MDITLQTLPCAVVFDLDGTLLDTESLYRTAFLAALAEFGRTIEPGAYDSLIGLSRIARRTLLPDMMGGGFPIELFLDAYDRHRTAALGHSVPVKPGAAALLDVLDLNHVPCAVATSASGATAHARLARARLAHRFNAVVTRDDVARGKPAPDSFVRAAALLGVAARDCLAIEDSPPGVRAAHAAGMQVIVVPDSLPPSTECLARCCGNLASLHDVADLLISLAEPDRTNNRFRLRV